MTLRRKPAFSFFDKYIHQKRNIVGDEYCIIRAYYNDTRYVDSNKFYATEVVDPSYVTGGINGDETITATDYILLKRAVMGTYTIG